MDLGLQGKWALVCGASKGLGLGCATALVQEGANVLMVARGLEALQASAAELIAGPALSTGATVLLCAQDKSCPTRCDAETYFQFQRGLMPNWV